MRVSSLAQLITQKDNSSNTSLPRLIPQDQSLKQIFDEPGSLLENSKTGARRNMGRRQYHSFKADRGAVQVAHARNMLPSTYSHNQIQFINQDKMGAQKTQDYSPLHISTHIKQHELMNYHSLYGSKKRDLGKTLNKSSQIDNRHEFESVIRNDDKKLYCNNSFSKVQLQQSQLLAQGMQTNKKQNNLDSLPQRSRDVRIYQSQQRLSSFNAEPQRERDLMRHYRTKSLIDLNVDSSHHRREKKEGSQIQSLNQKSANNLNILNLSATETPSMLKLERPSKQLNQRSISNLGLQKVLKEQITAQLKLNAKEKQDTLQRLKYLKLNRQVKYFLSESPSQKIKMSKLNEQFKISPSRIYIDSSFLNQQLTSFDNNDKRNDSFIKGKALQTKPLQRGAFALDSLDEIDDSKFGTYSSKILGKIEERNLRIDYHKGNLPEIKSKSSHNDREALINYLKFILEQHQVKTLKEGKCKVSNNSTDQSQSKQAKEELKGDKSVETHCHKQEAVFTSIDDASDENSTSSNSRVNYSQIINGVKGKEDAKGPSQLSQKISHKVKQESSRLILPLMQPSNANSPKVLASGNQKRKSQNNSVVKKLNEDMEAYYYMSAPMRSPKQVSPRVQEEDKTFPPSNQKGKGEQVGSKRASEIIVPRQLAYKKKQKLQYSPRDDFKGLRQSPLQTKNQRADQSSTNPDDAINRLSSNETLLPSKYQDAQNSCESISLDISKLGQPGNNPQHSKFRKVTIKTGSDQNNSSQNQNEPSPQLSTPSRQGYVKFGFQLSNGGSLLNLESFQPSKVQINNGSNKKLILKETKTSLDSPSHVKGTVLSEESAYGLKAQTSLSMLQTKSTNQDRSFYRKVEKYRQFVLPYLVNLEEEISQSQSHQGFKNQGEKKDYSLERKVCRFLPQQIASQKQEISRAYSPKKAKLEGSVISSQILSQMPSQVFQNSKIRKESIKELKMHKPKINLSSDFSNVSEDVVFEIQNLKLSLEGGLRKGGKVKYVTPYQALEKERQILKLKKIQKQLKRDQLINQSHARYPSEQMQKILNLESISPTNKSQAKRSNKFESTEPLSISQLKDRGSLLLLDQFIASQTQDCCSCQKIAESSTEEEIQQGDIISQSHLELHKQELDKTTLRKSKHCHRCGGGRGTHLHLPSPTYLRQNSQDISQDEANSSMENRKRGKSLHSRTKDTKQSAHEFSVRESVISKYANMITIGDLEELKEQDSQEVTQRVLPSSVKIDNKLKYQIDSQLLNDSHHNLQNVTPTKLSIPTFELEGKKSSSNSGTKRRASKVAMNPHNHIKHPHRGSVLQHKHNLNLNYDMQQLLKEEKRKSTSNHVSENVAAGVNQMVKKRARKTQIDLEKGKEVKVAEDPFSLLRQKVRINQTSESNYLTGSLNYGNQVASDLHGDRQIPSRQSHSRLPQTERIDEEDTIQEVDEILQALQESKIDINLLASAFAQATYEANQSSENIDAFKESKESTQRARAFQGGISSRDRSDSQIKLSKRNSGNKVQQIKREQEQIKLGGWEDDE